MPNASFLNFPYNEELWNYQWQQEADKQKTAIVTSGVMVEDSEIASQISNGSNYFTTPIYSLLTGEPDNYDGETDMTEDTTSGKSQSGIVYGRMHGWNVVDFIKNFNSGADPMAFVVSQLVPYWVHQRQSEVVGILNGVLGHTPKNAAYAAGWANHKSNIASTTTTIAASNRLGATTISDAAQKACGDNGDIFTLAIMHSAVANNYSGLQLTEFAKYTDAQGVQRPVEIGYANGRMIVVDDGVPTDSTTVAGTTQYTTYLLGAGVLRHAYAPVERPYATDFDPVKHGGVSKVYSWLRETIHPNGFDFIPPTDMKKSPTKAQLAASANWNLKVDPKTIAIASIVSNV